MTEKDYIDGLKKGDQNTFRKFVDDYQVPLLKLCNGFLHNREEAKDIVQEVFIEVFQSIGTFRGNSLISTWLYRIAINKSLNQIRKNKNRKLMTSLDTVLSGRKKSGINEIRDQSENSDKNIEQDELAEAIRIAVDSLPKNQRIAFVMNKYQDMSYKEIAEVLDVSLIAVESLIHRAKLNLQKRLYQTYKNNLR